MQWLLTTFMQMNFDPATIKSQGAKTKRRLRKSQSWQQMNKLAKGKLDLLFQNEHKQAFEEIDCLDCANCCRTLGPRIIDTDISRIARKLRMAEAQFVQQYLRIDEDGDYIVKSLPCPFLDLEDNYCSIYEDRPRACREYPHTDRRRQHQLLDIHAKNLATCPAVQMVLDQVATGIARAGR